jgi:uncharacterized protein HemX
MRLRRRSQGEAQPPPSEQPTAPVSTATPAGEPAGATAPSAPAPRPEQSLDGLRAWIAQVDRKVGVRTYAGAAAVILALAAGLAGAYLGATAKDESATKTEVKALRDQLESVQAEAASAAEESVKTVNQRLDELESRLNALSASQRTTESELQVVQDDIGDLRSEANRSGGGGR